MKSKTVVIFTVLFVVLVVANVVLITLHFTETSRQQLDSSTLSLEEGMQYTMYIGTDQQDTQKPVASKEDAAVLVNEICLKHTNAFTSFYAQGTWKKPDGAVFEEVTLVYVFFDIDEEAVTQIMDEVLAELDQYSILVEVSNSRYMFYSG